MAFETGTATDYLDLLSRVETFATLHGWTAERSTYDASTDTDGELILSGEGWSGSEAIIVGMRSYRDEGDNLYNWALRGFAAFNGSAWNDLPDPCDEVYLPLRNAGIEYWLMVNPQRIMLMAKVGTRYMHAYLGFLSTYSTDATYPYPLFIGGSSTNEGWKATDSFLGTFWGPSSGGAGEVRMPDGNWRSVSASSFGGPRPWPWYEVENHFMSDLRDGLGGVTILLPATLLYLDSSDIDGVLGELDGFYWVTGFGASAEDTVTVNGQDYVVGHSIDRVDDYHHCALELT